MFVAIVLQDALARGRSEQAGYNPFEDAVDTSDYGVGGGGGEGEGGGGGKKKEAQEAEKALKEETEASVFQLTTRVAAYKRMVDLLGTRKDTQTHREKLKGMGEDISILAKKTTHALKGLKPKGKRRKTQHAKLLKDFQNVLAEFQNSQRACAEKERGTLPVKTPVKRKKNRDRNASASASAGYGDQTQGKINPSTNQPTHSLFFFFLSFVLPLCYLRCCVFHSLHFTSLVSCIDLSRG